MFEILIYNEDEFIAFYKSLPQKLKAKAGFYLELLKEYGYKLSEPYSKLLEDGIYELRLHQSNNIARIFYFFDQGKIIVLTNAYIKKEQKINRRYIQRAKDIRKEYYNK